MYRERRVVYLPPFSEDELSKLMSYLPDDENYFRPVLQCAGENKFNW